MSRSPLLFLWSPAAVPRTAPLLAPARALRQASRPASAGGGAVGAGAAKMLRVQRHRRPAEWARKDRGISNRFLPLDPRDEIILDELERASGDGAARDEPAAFGDAAADVYDSGGLGEGPPAAAYGPGGGAGEDGRKWSRRSAAAKKRWADPEYRAKMLAKRLEKRRCDIANGLIVEGKAKVEIGRMDSITMSGDEKAKAINAYALSNKRRSEKLQRFHRDEKAWMQNRLSDGEKLRFEREDEFKKQRQEMRQKAARKRHARMRALAEAGPAKDEEVEEDVRIRGRLRKRRRRANLRSSSPFRHTQW